MLQPKKTKYRKAQKGKMKGNAQRGSRINFGTFGIKALKNVGLQLVKLRQLVLLLQDI